MAKITRATQKQFGSSAGSGRVAKFGSLAAGVPATYSGSTVTPANIQALTNYLQGWDGAVLGNGNPAIQDMNAIQWLYAYQIGYLLQEGVAEWDAGTTYYIGSIVSNGAGNLYVSKTDTNLNNALTSAPNWRLYGAPTTTVYETPGATGTYTTPAGCTALHVSIIGGGGGGAGSGTSATTGGNGDTSAFGTITAGGGSGGAADVGGAGSSGSGGNLISITGQFGQSAIKSSAQIYPGAIGGASYFGGAGAGGPVGAAGKTAQGHGGGGGGGGCNSGVNTFPGSGGGGGGYAESIITAPSATYAYQVANLGTAGAAGTSGFAGGAGGSGAIIVMEYYF